MIWLANPRRRTYRNLDFIPGVEDAEGVLNLWTGWALDPNPNASCSAWLELLHQIICGGDDNSYKWMLNWFANILREPRNKSLTAPVIIGSQGAGKSLMLGYFGRILGSGYITITNEEHIYGRFNRHLAHALLLHSEEALYGGERKHRGIIKSLITDEYRVLEQKGVDAKRVHNYLRLALTSNEDWAAPAEKDDRRFTVINMKHGGRPRMVGSKLLLQVLEELNGTGPAALFHYLLNMDYDPKFVRINIKNEDLVDLKKVNLNPIELWWIERLESGQILPDYLTWATDPKGAAWPEVVSSTALYAHFVITLKERMTRSIPDQTVWTTKLNEMVRLKLTRVQKNFPNPQLDDVPPIVKMMSNRHTTIVNIPTLEECRRAFEAYMGHKFEWPEIRDDTPSHMTY